ncbi:MAG: xylulokinase [Actinomycetota bacterium]|nr:xylulokinase [Actinomycetota bacterium]
MNDGVFVGLDLGTSSLKGAVVGADGAWLASASAAYPTDRPEPGRAEQDPADWWRAVRHVVVALRAEVSADRWDGIGLSGMVPTLVTAGSDGEPVGPAITWEDDRAEAQGQRFREDAGPNELYTRTGQWVDGRYLLPMFRWLEEHDAARAGATSRLRSAKDEIFRRLTGEEATDPSTATGFGCYELSGEWDGDAAGDVLAKLPEIRPSSFSADLLPPEAATLGLPAGLPVVLGAADSVAGAFGMGASNPGDRASLWGTSTVLLGIAAEPTPDPDHRYLITPLASGDGWGLEMDLVSTGSAFAWLSGLFGWKREEELMEAASRSVPGANGLTFLPYVGFGEQGALWDPALRGTLHGLTTQHSRGDIARALIEGILIEFRRCAAVLGAAGEIVVSGGPSASPFFCGLLASAVGATCAASPLGSYASAYGAGMLARTAAGAADADVTARPQVVRTEPGDVEIWNELAERHDALLAAVWG